MAQARLTYRDLEVLSYLREQGAATSEQLIQQFFPTAHTFFERISKLKRGGHVEVLKLREYLNEVPSKFRSLPTSLGRPPDIRYKMSVYRLGRVYKTKYDLGAEISSPIYWQHQFHLNAIRSFLETILTGSGFFVTDTEIRRERTWSKGSAQALIPDLVWREDNREFAFEFERSNKVEADLFSRFMKFDASRYAKVVYFAENDSIYSKIVRAAAAFPKIAVAHSSQPNKVFSRLFDTTTMSKFLGV